MAYTDMEETKEEQENRIEYFWKKGNQQFTEDGRTVDPVLQARAKLSENGPEDHREGDDQKVAHGEDLHNDEVLSGTISASDGVPKLVKGGEVGVLEEAGCSPDQRDQELRSNSADVGDVEVVCIMHPAAFGERKGAGKMEEAAHWWIGWDKLPTLASDGCHFATRTLRMAGGKESPDETRHGSKTNTVFGWLGCQDGL